MNRSISIFQITTCPLSPLFLLCLIGLTVFASPLAAQVFDSGPSDPALFDSVINVPTDPDILSNQSIGGDNFTTQLNLSDGGSIGFAFNAFSGGEVNISGGSVDGFFKANSGSEVNISGGFIGDDFLATSGSEVNIVGIGFFLDGVLLDRSMLSEAFTIVDRDVTLSARLPDGTRFSFDLNSNPPAGEPDEDFFDPNATLTVKHSQVGTLGDQGDGIVNFSDIPWFIGILQSGRYDAQADINQDGFVDFADIPGFIALLQGG